MKAKFYAQLITELAEKYPDADIVFASDEEGNCFSPVVFEPCLGIFDDGEFDDESEEEPNAICIN